MKKEPKTQSVSEKETFSDKKQDFILDLFEELYVKKRAKEEKELEVLVDKFIIRTKNTEILLENSSI